MILEKRNDNITSVIHTKNYFAFIGYCLAKNSLEAQKIDVYINTEKTLTLTSNLSNNELENIYDIEETNSCFEYQLPEQYIKRNTVISFKHYDTGEELVGSPIDFSKIENFNELLFLYSITQPIKDKKIKNVYCPNVIGFLATEENINDTNFVKYITELMMTFPDVEFKGFYYNDMQKSILLKTNLFRCKPHIIKHIQDIQTSIEIFIWNYKRNDTISGRIVSNIRNGIILSTIFLQGIKGITIREWENKPENTIIPRILNNLEYFDFTEEEKQKAKNSVLVMLNNKAKSYVSENIWEEISPKSSFYNFMNILIIKYWLNSQAFKYYYYETIHIKNERFL